MKLFAAFLTSLLCSTAGWAGDLKFRMQEIDTTLKVGYGVVIADVNGSDGHHRHRPSDAKCADILEFELARSSRCLAATRSLRSGAA